MTTYELTVDMVRAMRPVLERIGRQDPDLARQLRRAAASVPLNVAEGLPSRGRNRGAHLQRALGSARECVACLDVAGALGYASDALVADARSRVDRCCAALWCLVHRPRW